MKCLIVVMLVLLIALPVAAESTDVRLARMEEKLDYLIEQNRTRDAGYEKIILRLDKVEAKQEKHSFWFSVFGWVGGGAWAIILLILAPLFRRWFEKPIPVCEGG